LIYFQSSITDRSNGYRFCHNGAHFY